MKIHLKSGLFKTLDLVPSAIGYFIYHKLQQLIPSNKLEYKIPANIKTFKKLEKLIMKVNGSLENKNILEIGSGWVPIMPFFLKYLGKCNKIISYDLNEHYQKSTINELIQHFNLNYATSIVPYHKDKYNLPEWLTYRPKENVIHTTLPGNIDLIFSRFVLEHVPPEQIYLMHKKFKEIYDENTLIIHMISPSDHRAYSNSSLSLLDFLQYSQEEWDRLQTKFDYHNRLRLPQYMEIFKKLDFEILHLEYTTIIDDLKEYDKFQKLKIHNDYVKYTEEELTAGAINIVMRRKAN